MYLQKPNKHYVIWTARIVMDESLNGVVMESVIIVKENANRELHVIYRSNSPCFSLAKLHQNCQVSLGLNLISVDILQSSMYITPRSD
jgi:hypothetical protein